MDLTIEPSRLSMTSKVVIGVLLLVNFTVALYLIFAEPSSVRDWGQQAAVPAKQPLKLIDELAPDERVPRAAAEERAFSPQALEALSCRRTENLPRIH